MLGSQTVLKSVSQDPEGRHVTDATRVVNPVQQLTEQVWPILPEQLASSSPSVNSRLHWPSGMMNESSFLLHYYVK